MPLNQSYDKRPCIYIFKNKVGEIIYIGKAEKGFQVRLYKYLEESEFINTLKDFAKKNEMTMYKKGEMLMTMMQVQLIVHKLSEVASIEFLYSDSKETLKWGEAQLIQKNSPRYNVKNNTNTELIGKTYREIRKELESFLEFNQAEHDKQLSEIMMRVQEQAYAREKLLL